MSRMIASPSNEGQLKIAFCINSLRRGGAERVLTILANTLSERRFDCSVITSFEKPGEEYELNCGVHRFVLDSGNPSSGKVMRNLNRIARLRKICKEQEFDVLVSFMGEPNIRSLFATAGLRTKTIVSVRNDPRREYAGRLLGALSKSLFHKADWVVFQTSQAASFFSGAVRKKSSVILNPVGDNFFSVRPNLGSKVVVTCGRLVPQKNHQLLIKAFELAIELNEHWALEIVGSGPLRDELEAFVAERNLENHIHFVGETDNVPEVLSQASVFALSSDYEGLPNVLMEAMAAGLACVATDCPCGGPAMLITNNKNGLLVPVGDASAMAGALSEVMSDEQLRISLARTASDSSAQYVTTVIVDQWEELIRRITR